MVQEMIERSLSERCTPTAEWSKDLADSLFDISDDCCYDGIDDAGCYHSYWGYAGKGRVWTIRLINAPAPI